MHQQMITDTLTLSAFCKRMAREPFITVDTEFLREKTYWPILCLVQVGGAEEVAAIDPLAEGIDLTPLYTLLHNKNILKVFHAARQDLEIFFKLTGDVPEPIFDTQVAAQVSGMGESIGYEGLVKKLTGHQLDKSQRFTDWSRRPLTDAQIEYALGDVIYLHEAYQKLVADIDQRGRHHWIDEDMEMLHDAALYHTPPEEAWERVKFRASKPIQLARLQRLAAWREQTAQDSDSSRNRIIRDEVLTVLAIAAGFFDQRLSKCFGPESAENGFGIHPEVMSASALGVTAMVLVAVFAAYTMYGRGQHDKLGRNSTMLNFCRGGLGFDQAYGVLAGGFVLLARLARNGLEKMLSGSFPDLLGGSFVTMGSLLKETQTGQTRHYMVCIVVSVVVLLVYCLLLSGGSNYAA